MKRRYHSLQSIENNEPITRENNEDFYDHLQSALLLALREQGSLSMMQLRYAEEALHSQRVQRAKNRIDLGKME